MKTYEIIGKVIKTESLNCSKNGNPTLGITFVGEDGTEYYGVTAPDATCGYSGDNSDFRKMGTIFCCYDKANGQTIIKYIHKSQTEIK